MLLSVEKEQDQQTCLETDNSEPEQNPPSERKLYKILEEESSKCQAKKDAKRGEPPKPTIESIVDSIQNIAQTPIITNEVAIQLLRIQSKYLDDHPYLCTSRFRHTLHQLPDANHQVLEQLCFQLHAILLDSLNELCTEERKRNFFNRFITTVFDQAELKPKEDLFNCCLKHGTLDQTDKAAVCNIANSSLESKLHAVLARLVSDYRAIFAIECGRHEDDDGQHHFDHEHRKHRHEEDDDECPEEIKSMKVACEELSLECKVSKEVTESKKKVDSLVGRYYSSFLRGIKKGIHHHHHSTEDPNKHHRKGHHHKKQQESGSAFNFAPFVGQQRIVEKWTPGGLTADKANSESATSFDRISTGYRNNNSSSSSTSSGLSRGSSKQRKRKDRRDSFSDEQDKKLSRSDSSFEDSPSTEDPLLAGDDEDLVKKHVLQERNGTLDDNIDAKAAEKVCLSEDGSTLSEIETPLGALSFPELRKQRSDSLKENDVSSDSNDFKLDDPDSPLSSMLSSPCATASAASSSSDNDDDQDAPSRYRHGSWSSNSSLGSDDFSSYMQRPMSWTPQSSQSANEDRHFNSRRHMDPSHRHNADSQGSAKKAKLRQLQRQYSNVRKRLEELEQEQEKTQGYRLSQAEKLKLKPLRKLIAEQTRLKRQIRSCRDDESTESLYNASSVEEDAMPGSPGSDSSEVSESLAFLRQDSPRVSFSRGNNNGNHRDLESMRNTMLDIERTLKVQRQIAGRPFELENMTSEQLAQEKVDIQSALLQFEDIFGHPETDEEKSLVKSIYDRYRSVKRQVRRSSSLRSKDLLELETIPEDLEVPMTMATPQHRINIEITSGMSHSTNDPKKLADGIQQSLRSMDMPCFDTSTVHKLESNLHSMSRYELLQVQRKTREEKKLYRRAVKEKEERVFQETGRRKMSKDQRGDDSTYTLYKLSKSKLKLIEALLSKPGNAFI